MVNLVKTTNLIDCSSFDKDYKGQTSFVLITPYHRGYEVNTKLSVETIRIGPYHVLYRTNVSKIYEEVPHVEAVVIWHVVSPLYFDIIPLSLNGKERDSRNNSVVVIYSTQIVVQSYFWSLNEGPYSALIGRVIRDS